MNLQIRPGKEDCFGNITWWVVYDLNIASPEFGIYPRSKVFESIEEAEKYIKQNS